MTPVEWILNYRGDFPFYLSLQGQARAGRQLSIKQLAAIERAMQRESAPPPDPATFTIQPGQTLIIRTGAAKAIAFEHGLTRLHHAFEVVTVHRETAKAYNLTAILSAQKTAYCGICGLLLTNPESVQAGIGPICAEKIGVSFSGKSLDELREQLKIQKPVTMWLAKKSIKNLERKK